MLVDYPHEWRKHMIQGETRTFSKDTPQEIIDRARKINKKILESAGRPFFYFEEDEK